jgi:hypothetical protein
MYEITMINHKARAAHEWPQASSDDLASVIAFGDRKVASGDYDTFIISSEGEWVDVDDARAELEAHTQAQLDAACACESREGGSQGAASIGSVNQFWSIRETGPEKPVSLCPNVLY